MSSQAPPEHPPPPPPLPPLPHHQVYTSVAVNSNINDITQSSRRPHYDEVITRESLQYRAQRLQLEEQQQQQLRENYYSSVNSERGTTTGSELYAEIANGSASGTVHPTQQSHYYSRPSGGSGHGDDPVRTVRDRDRESRTTVNQPYLSRSRYNETLSDRFVLTSSFP